MHVKDAEVVIFNGPIRSYLALGGYLEAEGTIRCEDGAFGIPVRQIGRLEALQIPECAHTELEGLDPPTTTPFVIEVGVVPSARWRRTRGNPVDIDHGSDHGHGDLHGVRVVRHRDLQRIVIELEFLGQGDEVEARLRALSPKPQHTTTPLVRSTQKAWPWNEKETRREKSLGAT